MNKLVGAVVLMVLGYILISYFFVEEAEPEVITEIVEVLVPDTVYAEADTMYVTPEHTVAAYRYEPDMELLRGYLDIKYNRSTNYFMLDNQLSVISQTDTKIVKRDPKFFSFSVGVGYFWHDEENNMIMFDGGITIYERFSTHIAGTTSGHRGIKIDYRF